MTRLAHPSSLPAPPVAAGIASAQVRTLAPGTPSYVSSTGATVLSAQELRDPACAVIPPAPSSAQRGDDVSYIMTDRFVVTGSDQAYRIWKFRSADQVNEYPPTSQGWALAWAAFRDLATLPA